MFTQGCQAGMGMDERGTHAVMRQERQGVRNPQGKREGQHGAAVVPRRFPRFLIQLCMLAGCVCLPMAWAHAASCHFYQVTLQGTASIGDKTATSSVQKFAVSEYAMWRDAGVASHRVEFWLTAFQDLNASPQIGQIELMTNSAFARNAGIAAARYDLTSVAMSNVISFQVDSGASFILPSPNVFIAPGIGSTPGGLGGLGFLTGAGGQLGQIINSAAILSVSYFVPRSGTGYFYTDRNGSIAGQLDFVGTGLDNASFQGRYQAAFSGPYIGSVQCN